MRFRVLAPMVFGVLALAGAAAAQTAVEIPQTLSPPGDTGNSHQPGASPNEGGARQSRYLARIETLKEKVAKTKAQDGGQLTAEHEARLKRELERLNRIYGVNTG